MSSDTEIKEGTHMKRHFPKIIALGLVIFLLCAALVAAMAYTSSKQVTLPKPDEVSAVYIYSLNGHAGSGLARLSAEDQADLFTTIAHVTPGKPMPDPENYIGIRKFTMFRFEYKDGSCLDFGASSDVCTLNGSSCFEWNYYAGHGVSDLYYLLIEKYFDEKSPFRMDA